MRETRVVSQPEIGSRTDRIGWSVSRHVDRVESGHLN